MSRKYLDLTLDMFSCVVSVYGCVFLCMCLYTCICVWLYVCMGVSLRVCVCNMCASNLTKQSSSQNFLHDNLTRHP